MNEGNKFFKGALVLAVAGAIVKFLGAVYRIPLYSILGPEGIGLFQAAYPVYSMMLSISIAGVPVAVSKLVADKLARKNYGGALQVFRVALFLMTATGLIVTGVLLLGARYYAENLLGVPDVFYPLVAIAPAVLFFAVKSAFRGFFQGQQKMVPTALSQIIEQLVRVATIFFLASLLVRQSTEMGAAGAAFGTVTGAAVALLLLVYIYFRQKADFARLIVTGNNKLQSTRSVIREIFVLALPLTISSIVLPLVNAVDSTLILPRLQVAGFSETRAVEMFGDLTGAAMPLISLPTIFTVAISASLIPAIANASATNNQRLVASLSNLSTRLGAIIGLPAALGIFLLAEPISIMLFANIEVARPLTFAAFIIIFLSLQQTTAPVLQGLGKTFVPVRNTFIGLGFKVALNYILTAIPAVNILGPVIGTIVYFAVASFLNFRAISKTVGWRVSLWQSAAKPLLNTLIMGGAVLAVYPLTFRLLQPLVGRLQPLLPAFDQARLLASFTVLIVVLIGIVVYGLSSLLTGTITRRELEMIPRVGPKTARILSRFRLLRR